MKIVLNNIYGGISEYAASHRTDKGLIQEIEEGKYRCHSFCGSIPLEHLIVVELPNDITDFIVTDYDGLERIYYVLNGKIYCIHSENE